MKYVRNYLSFKIIFYRKKRYPISFKGMFNIIIDQFNIGQVDEYNDPGGVDYNDPSVIKSHKCQVIGT